jgi:hypothetical protein
MIHIFSRLILLMIALSVGLGCAIGSDPAERALRRSLETTSTAVDRGERAAEAKEEIPLRGRLNPCRCPAPDFEVYTRGRWQRVVIDGDEELLSDLVEQVESAEEDGRLVSLRLSGRFEGSTAFEDTGIEYPTFLVARFQID